MPARVLDEYQRRETAAHARLLALRAQRRCWVVALVVIGLLLLLGLWHMLRDDTGVRVVIVAVATKIAVLIGLLHVRRQAEWAQRQAAFYRESLERASGRKPQTGKTGQAFAPQPASSAALFAADLEVLGVHSLFGLLATTRTPWGEEALAAFLLEDAPAATIRSRQAAVRELAPDVDLREAVALLGNSTGDATTEKNSAAGIRTWLALPAPRFAKWLRPALLTSVAACIAILLAALLLHWPAGSVTRNLLLLWGAQMLLCWRVRPAILHELGAAKALAADVRLLREGLTLLKAQAFTAPHLIALQQGVSMQAGEARALRSLERTLTLVEQREVGWIFALGLFVAAGTQEAMSLARWRTQHAALLHRCQASWAEWEALVAVATYAGEHDELTYPEILDTAEANGGLLTADDLKHPLLPADIAVGNALRLATRHAAAEPASAPRNAGPPQAEEPAPFLIVSGSNMAGKSTLLRAVGLCVVLARSGAPVPAQRMRSTALRLGASLGIADSLADGRSRFLAEADRLARIARLAEAHPGEVLFLIDEILSGTNSADRRIAAESVVRALVFHGAVGALSTHDLALTEIADDLSLGGRNTHMASATPEDPLHFDFLLKPGPNRLTNGLAIVRLLGLMK